MALADLIPHVPLDLARGFALGFLYVKARITAVEARAGSLTITQRVILDAVLAQQAGGETLRIAGEPE